ncbi:MAG TPA: ABC transporter permease subunit [Acidimicrobiales bacterium]
MHRPSLALRVAVLCYVGALVALPLGFVFQQALSHGLSAFVTALSNAEMDSALWLTVRVAVVAVPLNVIFGLGVSLWILRRPSRVSRVFDTLIDLPLAVSPIIVGLSLELAYAQNGWLGRPLAAWGLHVMFTYWAIVVASVFVSLPLVSRQVIPLLRSVGTHQEQTAQTLGAGPVRIFLTVTLRSITWAAAYGVTLTIARIIGEYGAVLIVSGNIGLRTETLTLNISNNFGNFTPYQGFVGVSLLSLVSILVLLVLGLARHRERLRHGYRP